MADIDEKSESKANQLEKEAWERGAVKIEIDNKGKAKEEKKISTLAECIDDQAKGIVSNIDPESEEYFDNMLKKIKGKKAD